LSLLAIKKEGIVMKAKIALLSLLFLIIASTCCNRIIPERVIAQIDTTSWIKESFRVSPDSQRLAYAARIGEKRFVVADGQEGKQYDGIINLYGGRIVFDSPDRLHYLAVKKIAEYNKNDIYLVQEKI
jgi:hypothetical protein